MIRCVYGIILVVLVAFLVLSATSARTRNPGHDNTHILMYFSLDI